MIPTEESFAQSGFAVIADRLAFPFVTKDWGCSSMISLVVPCYNEFQVLDHLYERLSAAAESWNEKYEVVLVDDGSLEETWRKLTVLHDRDPHWKVIRFSRNFGHQTAISAGIFYAEGDCIIILDADLQDPPEELHKFLDKWREGYDVVYGVRTKRKEGIVKRSTYALFYRILMRFSQIPIPYDSGDFCLLDRKVADLLRAMPERNRFVRGLRAWAGFRQIGVAYERQAREAGESHYPFSKLLQLAVDGLFSFSTLPLRLITYLGLSISLVALLGVVLTLSQRIFARSFAQIGVGQLPDFVIIVIAVLFFCAIQLVCLGVMGEYIGRIYEEVKQRPLWVVRESLGVVAQFPTTHPVVTAQQNQEPH
jgi:dolichol-phosphate mannosyltransferase